MFIGVLSWIGVLFGLMSWIVILEVVVFGVSGSILLVDDWIVLIVDRV